MGDTRASDVSDSTGEQQTRLDQIKAKLASLGETRGIRAEGISVISWNPPASFVI